MKLLLAPATVLAVFALAACAGGYSSPASAPPTTTNTSGSNGNAAKFSTANVSGVGRVVVDGKGRTVYILTSSRMKNVPCTDASGCTGVWPPVTATYKGWRVYEYTGDTGSGQANGQGLKSFGGTWYVLNSSGQPVKQSSSGGGGGYQYP
jgi:predicted lipoprotein with Yx(FWY)xxD motif